MMPIGGLAVFLSFEMTIGYELSGYDNDSYMTGSCNKLFHLPFLPKCDKCGYRTDYRYTNKDFTLKRKTLTSHQLTMASILFL